MHAAGSVLRKCALKHIHIYSRVGRRPVQGCMPATPRQIPNGQGWVCAGQGQPKAARIGSWRGWNGGIRGGEKLGGGQNSGWNRPGRGLGLAWGRFLPPPGQPGITPGCLDLHQHHFGSGLNSPIGVAAMQYRIGPCAPSCAAAATYSVLEAAQSSWSAYSSTG